MATTSKRISQLTTFTKTQHDPLWQSCVVPANFNDLTAPEYPDTYKVPLSDMFLNIKDASFSGDVTFKKPINVQSSPILMGTTTTTGGNTTKDRNQSNSFIFKGTTVGNPVISYVTLTSDANSLQYLQIQVGSSWFFKLFVIGISSKQASNSTSVEFNGIIRNNNLNEVTFVGTPSKMIHSRDNISTDVRIEPSNTLGNKTILIKADGGTDINDTYNWTGRLDIVQV